MNEDIHKSNLSLSTQGLAWLFYKRAHVCAWCWQGSCFPVCGFNLITCLVHPHGNRHYCPCPSPARWPLQWPAPGPTERDREREMGYTPALRQNSASAAFKAAVMHECVRAAFVCTWKETRSAIHIKQACLRADQTHTHRVNLPDTYDFSFSATHSISLCLLGVNAFIDRCEPFVRLLCVCRRWKISDGTPKMVKGKLLVIFN